MKTENIMPISRASGELKKALRFFKPLKDLDEAVDSIKVHFDVLNEVDKEVVKRKEELAKFEEEVKSNDAFMDGMDRDMKEMVAKDADYAKESLQKKTDLTKKYSDKEKELKNKYSKLEKDFVKTWENLQTELNKEIEDLKVKVEKETQALVKVEAAKERLKDSL